MLWLSLSLQLKSYLQFYYRRKSNTNRITWEPRPYFLENQHSTICELHNEPFLCFWGLFCSVIYIKCAFQIHSHICEEPQLLSSCTKCQSVFCLVFFSIASFNKHRLLRSDSLKNTESPKVRHPILKRLRSVSTTFFQVSWSVTHAAAWTVDLHCEELVGAGRDMCPIACLRHRPAICGSFKPGRTRQTGKRLNACGRKG